MVRIVLSALFGAALIAGDTLAPPASARSPLPAWRREGDVVWTRTPDGRVKGRAYSSDRITVRPVLVVWLHGDLGPGSEPYELTRQIADLSDNVVAAAILRPGYDDAEGDRSAGRKGRAIGDNYTAQATTSTP